MFSRSFALPDTPVRYLFWQDKLIAAAEDELIGIADYSRSLDGIFFIGLPYEINGMLYNMAAVVSRGEVLAMVPKTFLPNYNEFYEARHFASGENLSTYVTLKNWTAGVCRY